MSNLVLVQSGANLLLSWGLVATTTPEGLTLKLYQNNYNPTPTDTAARYTEATFGGYSAATLTRANWSAPTTNSNGQAETDQPTTTWTATSAQMIYGYYVVGATSGTLLWAQAFDVPRNLKVGDTLSLTPSFTLTSQ
jgi:hypothetical protein